VTRAVALTGGWQTSRESSYVQASRARDGIDWFVARDELGAAGTDADRIARLARQMATSRRQIASLAYPQRTTNPLMLEEHANTITRRPSRHDRTTTERSR